MQKVQSSKPMITCLPNWLRGKVTPSEGWLLWILKSHYPNIFPSIETLAEESQMCEKTVGTTLKKLESLGLIKKINPFQQGNRRRSNTYELLLDKPMSVEVAKAETPCLDSRSLVNFTDVATQNLPTELGKFYRPSLVNFTDEERQLKNSKIKKPKLKKDPSQEKLLSRKKPPFNSPKGESHDFSDPWLYEEPGIEKQVSQQPAEKLQAPPSTTNPIEPSKVFALPAATQPQPQQPVKPWESAPPETPRDPAPTPAEEVASASAPALVSDAATAKPRRRAPRFVASEDQIPAELLPLKAEIMDFWAVKRGERSELAWQVLLRNAKKIQDDPDRGGTETVRYQLESAANGSWRNLDHGRWVEFGRKRRPASRANSSHINDSAPWRQPGLKGFDLAAAAEALAAARDDRNGLAYQEGPQQASETLLGASPCVVDVEVVA